MSAVGTETQIRYYGWLIVLIAFVLTMLCGGGFGLVAVLIKPLAEDFGWQRGDIALAYTATTMSAAMGGVAFGWVSDRRGVGALSAIGAVAMGACLLLLSRVSALWQLYGIFALFGALGHGAIYAPMTASTGNWFRVNRGLAVSIVLTGTAVGIGLVPLVASAVMADTGWRNALLYLGFGYLVAAVPLVVFVRDPPKRNSTEASPLGGPTLEERTIISPREASAWICTAIVFSCICTAVPQVHLVALASDMGLSIEQAASVLTVTVFSGAVGRLLLGRFADSLGPINVYIFASFGQTVLVFWFTQASSPASLYILATAFGLFYMAVSTGAFLTIRSLVPSRIAGTTTGLVTFFGLIGMGFGGYLGGLLFDLSGRYVVSFGVAAVSGAVNLVILLSLLVRLRHAAQEPIVGSMMGR